ncbi:MBG domain-containing protein [Kinneretia asaccharophila]|uniref:Filamentous hemagglutinin family protein n=1 Tax=Roseateles asaccharophilus TaxID=582607 RepID=A0A4R6MXZ0_9BURK|nr:MBG domain-containing protein [Roseateles asaccharophilus]MDN3546264.1 MBG domain-containing protein [Roseateles asaccharophilus]TDP05634.1 filamentous hemagglutinin family protein [Roseateles asaccharophilus]
MSSHRQTRSLHPGSVRRRLRDAPRLSLLALLCAGPVGPLLAAPAALPSGAQLLSGQGQVSSTAEGLRITQQSQRLALDWQQFSIGSGRSVEFVQPGRSAVAINRVLGTEVSTIQGTLKANGQVFLLNPNGIWFTPSAQVNVGSLVASTLSLQSEDLTAGRYRFEGSSRASIIHEGSIQASSGGAVALLAARVINSGTIQAPAGQVALGAGSRTTLDLGGPVLLQVDNETLETEISQGGAIRADGGRIWLKAQAANALTASVINHSGITEAQSLHSGANGEIILFAHGGVLNLDGSIKAPAGFVETSGQVFHSRPTAQVQAARWLLDPVNLDIDASLASTVVSALGSGDVTLTTTGSCTGVTCTGTGSEGNITVSSPVAWSSNNTLTLQADNNINVNAALTHTGTSAGGVIFLYGQASAEGGSSNYSASAAVSSPSVQWRKGSDQASLRYAIKDGNYFLGNKYMELGVCGPASSACSSGSSGGKFGTTNKPSLFFGRSTGAGVGMTGDADGFGSGADLRIDYFLPGAPVELFTAGYTQSSTTVSQANFANTANSAVFEFLPVGTGNAITLKYSAVLNSKLKTEQQVSLAGSNKYFTLNVALTNMDSSDLTNVQYARSFDPDNTQDKDGSAGFTTTNKIEQTFAAGDTASVVSATSAGSGNYFTAAGSSAKIVYFSTDADSKVGYGSAFYSNLSGMTSAANALSKGNSITADTGIGIIFSAGTLTPGQSKNYTLRASLDNRSIADILSDLNSAAGPVSLAYTLGPAGGSRTYRGTPYELASLWSAADIFGASYSAWVPGNDYTFVFNGSNVTGFTNAGSYTGIGVNILRSGFQVAASGNTPGSLNISPAPLSVTAINASKTYDGSAFAGGNGVSYSGFVNGESAAVLGGTLAFSGASQGAIRAGSYALMPQGLSSTNYDISYVPGSLSILQRPITVAADSKSKTYGDSDPGLTWSVVSGTLVSGDGLSGSLSREAGQAAGSYRIDASALSNPDYLISAQSGTLSIQRRPISIRADDKNKIYGDSDPSLSWSVVSGELISGDTLKGSLSRDAGQQVGSYRIDVSGLSNPDYLISTQNGSLNIQPRPLSIRPDSLSKYLGENDPLLTWSLRSGNLLPGDMLTGSLVRQPGEAIGRYAIDASALSNSNYLLMREPGYLEILPDTRSAWQRVPPPPEPSQAKGGGVVFLPDGGRPVSPRLVSIQLQTADGLPPQEALNQLVPELRGSGVRTPSLPDLQTQFQQLEERLRKEATASP